MATSTNGVLMLNTSSVLASSDFNKAQEDAPVSVDNIALVEIEIVSQWVSEVSRHKKTNLSGQIGTFGIVSKCSCRERMLFLNVFLGGTLGLFTGMSIISMFELAYWVGKAFFVCVGKRNVV